MSCGCSKLWCILSVFWPRMRSSLFSRSKWFDVVIKTALKRSCLLSDCDCAYVVSLLWDLTVGWAEQNSSVSSHRRSDQDVGWTCMKDDEEQKQHSRRCECNEWNRLLSWIHVELCFVCSLDWIHWIVLFFLHRNSSWFATVAKIKKKKEVEIHSWCSNVTLVCTSH